LHITVVTHYFPAHGGGIERVAGHICAGLAIRHGVTVEWFASRTDAVGENHNPSITMVPVGSWNGIERLTGLPYPLWSPRALLELSRAVARSDAVHVHDFSYPSSIFASIFARWHGVPLLLTQHTGAVRTGNRVFSALFWIAEQTIGRWMFAIASRVACVAQTTHAHWRPRARDEAKLVTIWNGLDFEKLRSPRTRTRAQLRGAHGLDPNRPIVLFAGRRVRKKGINIVRGVAVALPDVQFLVAGRGPCDPRKWALPNVRVLGYVDSDGMAQIYELADVLLLPSYSEGFPLVVQEALGCGAMILSTDEVAGACPPVADLITHCPVPRRDNSEPWIAALRRLLVNWPRVTERQARKHRARAIWSWERCVDSYYEVLVQTCSGTPKAAGGSLP